MKRGTERLLKFKRLKLQLGLRDWQAKGLLQAVWDFAAENAPRGDVGRFTDPDIALGIDYDGDPEALVAALVECGWLDEHPEHRLVVHDWYEHVEDYVHLALARRGDVFATGEIPRMRRMSVQERARLEKQYVVEQNHAEGPKVHGNGVRTTNTQEAHGVRTVCAQEAHEMHTVCACRAHEKRTAEADANAIAYANADADIPGVCDLNSRARARKRGGPPQSVGSVGIGAVTPLSVDGLVSRIEAVAREPAWTPWWRDTLQALADAGGDLGRVDEHVRYAEDCADARVRRAKDLGELTEPGRWLSKQVMDLCRVSGVRWGRFPAAARTAP